MKKRIVYVDSIGLELLLQGLGAYVSDTKLEDADIEIEVHDHNLEFEYIEFDKEIGKEYQVYLLRSGHVKKVEVED